MKKTYTHTQTQTNSNARRTLITVRHLSWNRIQFASIYCACLFIVRYFSLHSVRLFRLNCVKSAKLVEKPNSLTTLFVFWIIEIHWFSCMWCEFLQATRMTLILILVFASESIRSLAEKRILCEQQSCMPFLFDECLNSSCPHFSFLRSIALFSIFFFYFDSFYWNFGRHWKHRQKPFSLPYTQWLFPVSCHNEYGRIQ